MNKKIVVILTPYMKYFDSWVAKNGKPDEQYIHINGSDPNEVRGLTIDRIEYNFMWHTISPYIIELAEMRVRPQRKNVIILTPFISDFNRIKAKRSREGKFNFIHVFDTTSATKVEEEDEIDSVILGPGSVDIQTPVYERLQTITKNALVYDSDIDFEVPVSGLNRLLYLLVAIIVVIIVVFCMRSCGGSLVTNTMP